MAERRNQQPVSASLLKCLKNLINNLARSKQTFIKIIWPEEVKASGPLNGSQRGKSIYHTLRGRVPSKGDSNLVGHVQLLCYCWCYCSGKKQRETAQACEKMALHWQLDTFVHRLIRYSVDVYSTQRCPCRHKSDTTDTMFTENLVSMSRNDGRLMPSQELWNFMTWPPGAAALMPFSSFENCATPLRFGEWGDKGAGRDRVGSIHPRSQHKATHPKGGSFVNRRGIKLLTEFLEWYIYIDSALN